MSHLHMPDGILPLWLCIVGYILIGIHLLVFRKYFKSANSKKIALAGVMSALMIVAMSVEVPPISYHVNLAALSGILLGPVLSVLTIFTTNIILAMLGHGGVTVVGLNTVIVSIEAIFAYFIFKLLSKRLKDIRKTTFISVFTALMISTATMIGVIYMGTGGLEQIMHDDCEHSKHEKKHDHENSEKFDIKKFITIVLIFGMLGWIAESTLSAFIIGYISRIKPDVLKNNEDN